MEEATITSIKVGENREIAVETLLLKLGIVQSTLNQAALYIERTRSYHENTCPPPLDSHMEDAKQQLADVYFSIKCACRGFNTPGIVETLENDATTINIS